MSKITSDMDHSSPFIALGCHHVISLGLLSTGLLVCDYASQDEDRTLPLIQEQRCQITDGGGFLEYSLPRPWTYSGLVMAESRGATAGTQLTH